MHKLRPIESIDLYQIFPIEQAVYPFPWSRRIFEDCLRVGYSCWLSEQIVIDAYGIMSVAAQEAHILNLCVRTEMQRQGLGRQMLTHLLDIARQQNVEKIFLEVRRSNQQAINLYQSFKFSQIGIRKSYYQAVNGREDAIVFAFNFVV